MFLILMFVTLESDVFIIVSIVSYLQAMFLIIVVFLLKVMFLTIMVFLTLVRDVP
jgi:hypothetical protein